MKDFLKFIKKTWWLFLILFFAPIVVISIFAYQEYILGRIDLNAGEWASLFGASFGFWGTALLGSLAFWQNERVTQLNERLSHVKEIELEESNRPELIITGIELYTANDKSYKGELKEEYFFRGERNYRTEIEVASDDYEKGIEAYITVKNQSKVKIVGLVFNSIGVFVGKDGVNIGNHEKAIEKIEPNEEVDLYTNVEIKEYGFVYNMNIRFKNVYGHEYSQLLFFGAEIIKKGNVNVFDIYIRKYIKK